MTAPQVETTAEVIQLCDALKSVLLSTPGVISCTVHLGSKPFTLDITVRFGFMPPTQETP